MAEKAGRKCPELIQPEIPSEVKYLWRWFCEVSQGKQYNGTVINFLSWTEIKAWADLLDRKPNEWELMTIRAMDREFVNV